MAAPLHLLPALLLLLLPAIAEATPTALLGVCYGGNPPPATAVPQIAASLGVGRVRVYNADPATLHAFADTGIELVVGVPDEDLAAVSTPAGAADWVRASIQPALPATKIAYLAVSNAILTGANSSALSNFLLPAMQSLHEALDQAGLGAQVAVTTAHDLGVLATTFPPSSATFREDLLPALRPIIAFHSRTRTPFFVNAYPYLAYAAERAGRVDLEPGYPGVVDPVSGLLYTDMLAAQVDAVYHAIAVAARTVEVRVSETGWPSAGDANETGASPRNAARYTRNVMRIVSRGKGTPFKPAVPLRVYLFADGTPAYELSYHLLKDSTIAGNDAAPHSGSPGGGITDRLWFKVLVYVSSFLVGCIFVVAVYHLAVFCCH